MGRSHSGDEQKRSAAGDRGREGFGDDAGTRVGRPDPAAGADRKARQGAGRDDEGFSRGPSTQPVDEGLEGAVLDDEPSNKARARSGRTKAGNEAARGIQDANDDREGAEGGTRGGTSRRGSEPLEGRTEERESNYGGKMGRPRKQ
ncbi:MAG TPA: hypothetical protein VGE02_07830 [Gemmatimonadales bacterium]